MSQKLGNVSLLIAKLDFLLMKFNGLSNGISESILELSV